MRILLIAARHHIVLAAKQLDFEVVLFENKDRLLKKTFELSDETHIIDWNDHKFVLSLAQALHREKPFDAVFAFGEMGITPAAIIKEELNIKGNPLYPVNHSKNKGKMRKLLNKNNISPVKFAECSGSENIKSTIKEMGFPSIIKPISGTASTRVQKINNYQDVDEFLSHYETSEIYEVIIEEYLEGREFSVETLSFDGKHLVLGITEKFTTGEPNYIETGHIFPATSLTGNEEDSIVNVTIQLLNCLEHQNGPGHTEIKLTSNGPKVIETHTRPGGDNITDLIRNSLGVDVFYETFKHIKGLQPTSNIEPFKFSGICFTLCSSGVVTNISGKELIEKHYNVEKLDLQVSVGEEISNATDSISRHGYTLFTSHSREKAREMLKFINENLNIKVRENK
ncbi:ATP-grasp domain-containing protein [Salipaludibacillus sp. LMS25]|jgi:predicted ATP-grasp superfamily ATP-dependent carboligase|uniref:ATP-grasp domain-containing protein n=1 Tax=Salipaludibacillus sp. LMS25 TaxID=2924031 RepID=UPI0020D047E6|nr:ATP-grasp domain-containing protein [Salipaludibacillus sp. LMS25]UTR13426.1 ATP-grasp domain-containing protein [Salipaludibacillus sp. LMS25]